MIRLIAHRGLPESIDGVGANTLSDYERAFKRGLDVEMDVRFHGRRILCSHDPIDDDGPISPVSRYPTFEDFCSLLRGHENVRGFVNVKCDGMTGTIREVAQGYGVLDRIVTFDHSMPDFYGAEREYPDTQRACRAGAFEVAIGIKKHAERWVWLDTVTIGANGVVSFVIRRVKRYAVLNERARIIVVSPDIHIKDPAEFDKVNMPGFAWEIARLPIYAVLTDRPTMFGFTP